MVVVEPFELGCDAGLELGFEAGDGLGAGICWCFSWP